MTPHVLPRVYWLVFIVLMALLGATVGANYIDMGIFNPVVALGIAGIKAVLVVLFFMHVRYSSRLTWLFCGAGALWLGILMALVFSDYLTRGWLPDVGR